MAKKSIPVILGDYDLPPRYDNNPDGPSPLPDDRLNGTRHPNGKFDFVNLVGKGESPARPDVDTVNANGVAKSRGQGKNCQYNWGDDLGGAWNDNKDWTGGNLTGM